MKEIPEKIKIKLAGFMGPDLMAMVLGLKKAQRGVVPPADYSLLKELYRQLGFSVTKAGAKAVFDKGLQKRSAGSAANGSYIFFASKNKNTAERLKKYEEIVARCSSKKEHDRYARLSGRLLGYPKCCTEFFLKVEHLDTPSIYFEVMRNTKGRPMAELNALADSHVYDFVPCSFNCAHALRYAQKIVSKMHYDISGLSGGFIFFRNGSWMRLNLEKSGGGKKIRYRSFTAHPGVFGGYGGVPEAFNTIGKYLSGGDSISVGSTISIFKGGKKTGTIGGAFEDWIWGDFK